MLELKNITKVYPAAGENVEALKGISLRFRNSEFVSILGPSGCGKTTLLNIIGGLDQYTSGDLIIRGRSTKEYRDRDWDAYRNHSVGFVFQNYNLIPHQTVLQNVELALSLSGVPKAERRKRAKEALEQVGLKGQLRKKPAEMSGGQMQRVAIARAIVNNPDIILADEPTGALDSETSVQVMEILKEISKDRLVVMVTHNPDLAEQYSTRVIRMLDGKITGDSAPLFEREAIIEAELDKKWADTASGGKKPSLSWRTSFGLSLNNLFSKKGRTALTSFAGSIGIIGIALIYAVSEGMTAYIDSVQEETLSSYPLAIEANHTDTSSLLASFMEKAQSGSAHEDDAVYRKTVLYDLLNSMSSLDERTNDLATFRKWLETEKADGDSKLHDALSGVRYVYSPELLIYTKNVDGDILRADTETLMTDLIRSYAGVDMSSMMTLREQSGLGGMSAMQSSAALWRELVPGENGASVNEVTEKQYELVYGNWPARYDEIVLFLDRSNELNEMTLYAMGLISGEEIGELARAAQEHTAVSVNDKKWSYEEICSTEFRTILAADCYAPDTETGVYSDLRKTATGLNYLYDNGMVLHVTGIVKPAENAITATENGGIGYTHFLTEYILSHAEESPAAQAQKADPGTDIFTGLPFRDAGKTLTDEDKAASFRAYLAALTPAAQADTYIRIHSVPDPETLSLAVAESLAEADRDDLTETLAQAMTAQTGMSETDVRGYLASMNEEDFTAMAARLAEEQIKARYAAEAETHLSVMTREQLAALLYSEANTYDTARCAQLYDEILTFSDSTYETNLSLLGCSELGSPSSIELYASTFEDKDAIKAAIEEYNAGADDLHEIQYTDYVGLMMSSVTTIIRAITYVLIAFVAVSLIVSSIMIGVITLISVQERTREIGILRAIGASKRNVSGMFDAETAIIGLLSGTLGVGITYLLCVPINVILHRLTGIGNLSAYLPPKAAAALILLSVCLTLIAGVIPSAGAAKKDPVVALRSE